MMGCELRRENTRCVVLEGRIDFSTVLPLRQAGEQAIDAADGELCIDFAAVSFCNTVALSLMLGWLRHAKRAACELRFLNLPEELTAIARLAELDALLGLETAD